MASYVYPPVVLPGQSPPLAVVTPQDHRAWVYNTTALGISMTILSSAIRIFTRCGTRSGWGLDDAVLTVSTIVSLMQSTIVIVAGSYGLGSSNLINSEASLDKAQRFYYAGNLLYIIVLATSRQSVTFFLRRVTPMQLHRRALTSLLGVDALWILVFLLVMALQCNVSHPWLLGRSCANVWFARWEALEITGAVLEVVIFAMATWALVWDLQVTFTKRAIIVIAFALRMVPQVIIIGFHLASFDRTGFAFDPTLHETSFICWTQAEMYTSMIGATIPIAHRFVASLVTYYGGAGGRNLSQSEQARYRSTLQSTKSSKMEKSGSTKSKSQPQKAFITGAREAVKYRAGVDHRNSAVGQAPRPTSDSQRMMIRKEITYEVEYDT